MLIVISDENQSVLLLLVFVNYYYNVTCHWESLSFSIICVSVKSGVDCSTFLLPIFYFLSFLPFSKKEKRKNSSGLGVKLLRYFLLFAETFTSLVYFSSQ